MLTSAALLLAVAGSATAQFPGGLNYTTSGPLNVTASQIPENMRNIWCNSQQTVCTDLCDVPSVNSCNATDLAYDCKCSGGPTPNISAYEQSMPFFICTYWRANCVDNHPNDFTGIQNCLSVVCGTKNASAVKGSSSSSSTSAPGSSSTAGSQTSSAASGSGGSATTTSSKGMAAATAFAQNYGTQLLAGGMLAAFGFAL